MEIAFIVPSLAKKGPVIVVYNLIKSIINQCDLIIVYYFDDTDDALDFPCETVKIHKNEMLPFCKFNIIHSHGYRPEKYVYKWRKCIEKAKTVVTIHCDITTDLKYTYNNLVSMIFSRIWFFYISKFDYKIAISNKIQNIYEKKFNSLHKIYNGVEIVSLANLNQDLINKFLEIKNNGYKILYTYAVLTKRKGIDQLLELLHLRSDLHLIIVGDGKEKALLINTVTNLEIGDRVTFFESTDLPYNYINLCDIFVMPSRSEGFGLALVEAALSRASIVCSDIDVFKELFDNNQVTFFELENIDSLSKAVDIGLEYGDIKKEKSFYHSKLNYTSTIMGQNYMDFYKKILF